LNSQCSPYSSQSWVRILTIFRYSLPLLQSFIVSHFSIEPPHFFSLLALLFLGSNCTILDSLYNYLRHLDRKICICYYMYSNIQFVWIECFLYQKFLIDLFYLTLVVLHSRNILKTHAKVGICNWTVAFSTHMIGAR
jgi:hypothetical protein